MFNIMEKVLEKFTIDDVEEGDSIQSKYLEVRKEVVKKELNYVLLEGNTTLSRFELNQHGADNDFFLIKKSNQTETQKEQQPSSIKSVLSGIDKLLEYKESKYGNALNNDRLKVFSGKCKFGDILDAKLNRVANGEELLKNDVVDIAGYLILTLREKGWDDFSEFMD